MSARHGGSGVVRGWKALLAAFVLASGAPARADDKAPDDKAAKKADPKAQEKSADKSAKPKTGAALEWLSLDVGLVQARKRYSPIVVAFDPATADPPTLLADALGDTSLRDVLKKFVLIRVTPDDLKKEYPSRPDPAREGKDTKPPAKDGDPPPAADAAAPVDPSSTVSAQLGLQGEKPAVVVLNYWEEILQRYVAEAPARSKLKEALNRIWKVNELFALEARKLEPVLEKSRYAWKLKDTRQAVLKIRDFESPKAQTYFDPNLKKKLGETIQEYRAKAQEAIRDADKLDTDKKYLDAIEAYNKIMANFPFKDVETHAAKRKGELLRKATFGG